MLFSSVVVVVDDDDDDGDDDDCSLCMSHPMQSSLNDVCHHCN